MRIRNLVALGICLVMAGVALGQGFISNPGTTWGAITGNLTNQTDLANYITIAATSTNMPTNAVSQSQLLATSNDLASAVAIAITTAQGAQTTASYASNWFAIPAGSTVFPANTNVCLGSTDSPWGGLFATKISLLVSNASPSYAVITGTVNPDCTGVYTNGFSIHGVPCYCSAGTNWCLYFWNGVDWFIAPAYQATDKSWYNSSYTLGPNPSGLYSPNATDVTGTPTVVYFPAMTNYYWLTPVYTNDPAYRAAITNVTVAGNGTVTVNGASAAITVTAGVTNGFTPIVYSNPATYYPASNPIGYTTNLLTGFYVTVSNGLAWRYWPSSVTGIVDVIPNALGTTNIYEIPTGN